MLKKVYETPSGAHYFLGYYDKSPLDKNNERLLACRAGFIDRMPTDSDTLDIGYFVWNQSHQFVRIAQTKAWNWQQGAMAQWTAIGDGHVIYNDRLNGKFVSVLIDPDSFEKTVLPMAYYTLSRDGRHALCIDNERHYWCRQGYSYQGISVKEKNVPVYPGDGIWRMDIPSGSITQIVNITDLIQDYSHPSMKNGVHYLEHLMLSPNGKRFCFLHRWTMPDGGTYSRMFTANIDGGEVHLLCDSGRVSHMSWVDASSIVAWAASPTPINTLRKYKAFARFVVKPLMPFYRAISRGNSIDGNTRISRLVSGDGYMIFFDQTSAKKKVFDGVLVRDGHPSVSPANKSLMVTDTYPARSDDFQQELILCDLDSESIVNSAKIPNMEAYAGRPNRCDLHPKWSSDGKYISVDTLYENRRRIAVYDAAY